MQMKIVRARLIALSLFAATTSGIGHAQVQRTEPNAVTAFDDAVQGYTFAFKDLLRSRGVRSCPIDGYGGSCDELELNYDVLRKLIEITHPDGGLLFFRHSAAQLETWIVTGDRESPAYSLQAVQEDSVAMVIENLRRAMGVESLNSDRGAGISSSGQVSAALLTSSIDAATTLLLPLQVRDAIGRLTHLMVVPINAFGTVPFAVLRPFGTDEFLIDRMAVSVAPSFRDFIVSLQVQVGERNLPNMERAFEFSRPLIIGNPTYRVGDDWMLAQLPGAQDEALAIAELLEDVALIQSEATLDRVKLRAPEADLLYFATHGVASASNPLDGSRLFFNDSESWTAREIQETRLTAGLAVLSACQTGLGSAHGAGIIGLARAFILAGTSDVVMSLWSVDDEATQFQMTRFMTHLLSGSYYSPAGALREAMLETRERYPEPARWAAFTHFGVPRP